MSIRVALWVLLTLTLGCGGGSANSEPADSRRRPGSGPGGAALGSDALGDGFVVWESDRAADGSDGRDRWRLWTRRLDGTGLAPLIETPAGSTPCCPHISPDGKRLAYMVFRGRQERYPQEGTTGELRIADLAIGPDGRLEARDDRRLAPQARTYHENRVAVWTSTRDGNTLAFIRGDGVTVEADVETGETAALIRDPAERHGWLPDPTLRWATQGWPSFSPIDRGAGRVRARTRLGGCQPYFSGDGRFGFWTGGAGGPILRIDLETRQVETLLRKFDPGLDGRGYLYFPMASRDGTLLAFGASRGQHDQFDADYDLFVGQLDPETFLLRGEPVRLTRHPAVDRFPDVWAAPLPLGRRTGEAPLATQWKTPDGAPRAWDLGDGTSAQGAAVSHRYEQPGTYRVRAMGPGLLEGLAVVRAAAPPTLEKAELVDGGGSVRLRFDEPVDIRALEIRFVGERRAGPPTLSDDGRSISFASDPPVERGTRLEIRGLRDRADAPNELPPTTVNVPPPTWPSDENGLVFLWRTGDSANLVRSPEDGADVAATVEASGRARYDRHFRMLLARGVFVADAESRDRVANEVRNANEFALEATVTPAGPSAALGRIVSQSGGPGRTNFFLGEKGGRFTFRFLAKKPREDGGLKAIDLGPATPGRTARLAVSYSPGRIEAWRDGEPVPVGEAHGDFYFWKPLPLTFGGRADGSDGWDGTLEGIAIWNRPLTDQEVRENQRRYERWIQERSKPAETIVRASATRFSRVPSLDEITPYRQAVVIDRWKVLDVLQGDDPGPTILVARWGILDGQRLPGPELEGEERLVLEPLETQPQLDATFVADDFQSENLPRFFRPHAP